MVTLQVKFHRQAIPAEYTFSTREEAEAEKAKRDQNLSGMVVWTDIIEGGPQYKSNIK